MDNRKLLNQVGETCSEMEKHNEKYILVSSPEVTELLKGLVEKAIKYFQM